MKLKWWFSLVLGAVYLGIFHFWMTARPLWVVISGLVVSGGLGILLFVAAKRRYFVNLWDGLFHASVILDIFLEAT